LGAWSVVPATRPHSQLGLKGEQMSKKRKKRREASKSYEFDPEVMREINRQTQAQQKIENRRKKRTLIFWGGAIFGVVVIAAISVAFLLALGLW